MTPADPKRTEDTQMDIPDFVVETLARGLLPQVQAYFSSPEGQAAFEEWKRNKKSKEENQ